MARYHGDDDIAYVEKNISRFPFYIKVPFEHPPMNFKRLGTRSLEETGLLIVARSIQDLTPRTLESIPWHIGAKIYQKVKHGQAALLHIRTCRVEFKSIPFLVWKTFVTAYAQEARSDAFPDIRAELSSPFSVPDGIETGTAWLTQLSVHTSLLDFQDIFDLSKIPSLAILSLNSKNRTWQGLGSEVDDRLIHHWARSTEANGFPSLRIISFHGCEYLTAQCLGNLAFLRSLELMYFDDCKQMPQRESYLGRTSSESNEWDFCDVKPDEDTGFQTSFPKDRKRASSPGQSFWIDWLKQDLRILQGKKPVYNSEGEQDLKKPILSVTCGFQPAVLEIPLIFRRASDAGVKYHTAKIADTGTTEQLAGDSKRRLKKQKLNGIGDFTAMISGD